VHELMDKNNKNGHLISQIAILFEPLFLSWDLQSFDVFQDIEEYFHLLLPISSFFLTLSNKSSERISQSYTGVTVNTLKYFLLHTKILLWIVI
jgi:hypothetical protein